MLQSIIDMSKTTNTEFLKLFLLLVVFIWSGDASIEAQENFTVPGAGKILSDGWGVAPVYNTEGHLRELNITGALKISAPGNFCLLVCEAQVSNSCEIIGELADIALNPGERTIIIPNAPYDEIRAARGIGRQNAKIRIELGVADRCRSSIGVRKILDKKEISIPSVASSSVPKL